MSAVTQNQPVKVEINQPTFWNKKQLRGTARMQDQWGMSNVLKVSFQETNCTLDGRGWSRRRIARELGIVRETVGRYLLLAKPAISTPGSEES
jgi:hypothetical protein